MVPQRIKKGTGMTTFNLLLVALIQGITEFLPVSSSGHLILLPELTGMADQGQTIDVAVHVGTLGAVLLYFFLTAATGYCFEIFKPHLLECR